MKRYVVYFCPEIDDDEPSNGIIVYGMVAMDVVKHINVVKIAKTKFHLTGDWFYGVFDTETDEYRRFDHCL